MLQRQTVLLMVVVELRGVEDGGAGWVLVVLVVLAAGRACMWHLVVVAVV